MKYWATQMLTATVVQIMIISGYLYTTGKPAPSEFFIIAAIFFATFCIIMAMIAAIEEIMEKLNGRDRYLDYRRNSTLGMD